MSKEKEKIVIDFIGIGAQKAGTSWIYSNLKSLPDFSFPPMKEIHYFDRNKKYPSPNYLSEANLIKRFGNRYWLKKVASKTFDPIMRGDLKRLKWNLKWGYSIYSNDWYLSLFKGLDGIKGEISPSYSFIDQEDVKKMYEVAPHAKLIFIVRDPIDRAWSHYRFVKNSLKTDPNLSEEENIIKFIDARPQSLRSDYLSTLNNYTAVYPKEQILLCFYDAISEQPAELLEKIVSFIGGNPEHIPTYCKLSKRVNVSEKQTYPDVVFEHLKEKYYSQIKSLADQYGGYFNHWLELYYNEKSSFESQVVKPAIRLSELAH